MYQLFILVFAALLSFNSNSLELPNYAAENLFYWKSHSNLSQKPIDISIKTAKVKSKEEVLSWMHHVMESIGQLATPYKQTSCQEYFSIPVYLKDSNQAKESQVITLIALITSYSPELKDAWIEFIYELQVNSNWWTKLAIKLKLKRLKRVFDNHCFSNETTVEEAVLSIISGPLILKV